MFAVPEATPVTIPVEPTVAIAASLVLQVPPVIDSVRVVVSPMQAPAEPVRAAGVGLTVTFALPDKSTEEHAGVVILTRFTAASEARAPVLKVTLPLTPIVAVAGDPPSILYVTVAEGLPEMVTSVLLPLHIVVAPETAIEA